MFSYQSVNAINIVSLEDSEKNGNLWKMTFYLKKMCFHNIWNFLFLVKTMIYPKHKLAKSTFLGVKDTQIWPEKEVNPLRG